MLWREKYEIGVDHIDRQHKELFHRVAEFVNSIKQEGNWEEKTEKVCRTLEFMKDYVIVHFKDEEDYQKDIGYPDLEEHKESHDAMAKKIEQVELKFKAEGLKEELIEQFAGELLSWLINHVTIADLKIGEYNRMKSRNARNP